MEIKLFKTTAIATDRCHPTNVVLPIFILPISPYQYSSCQYRPTNIVLPISSYPYSSCQYRPTNIIRQYPPANYPPANYPPANIILPISSCQYHPANIILPISPNHYPVCAGVIRVAAMPIHPANITQSLSSPL